MDHPAASRATATAWPDPQPHPGAPSPAGAASPQLEALADTDALARVQEEIERVLEAVPRALQRLRRGAAPAEVDPATVLQLSVRQMQQVAGALRIAGFTQAARLPLAIAELLAKAAAQPGPPGNTVVEGVEHGCASLRSYLRRWRAGQPLSALALYPAWSTLQTLSGAERVHPAELWPVPWRWQALPPDERMPPLQPDAATRAAAEQLTLALMRDARSVAAARLSDLFAALARGAADGRMATLWGLASAVYEGQAKGLLAPEVHLKRVSSRLLAQLRRGPLGTADTVVQLLAHDLLFFCAQAGVQAQAGATPRLAAVRRTWGLEPHPVVDVEHALPAGHDATLLAHTLRQLAAVQALWDAAATGTPRPGQREAVAQLAQSLRQLLPPQATAVEELTQTLQHVMAEPGAATSAAGLEVAQALLALQLLLQEQEAEAGAAPLQRLSERIAQALALPLADPAQPVMPVEPWLLGLAQRGAERQALTALGQSVRTALNEAGLQLDALALAPDAATLQALGQRLQRLQGVLSVLSQPALAQSLQHLREALPADPAALDAALAARLARRLARLDLACERLALGLSPTEGLPSEEALDAAEAPAPTPAEPAALGTEASAPVPAPVAAAQPGIDGAAAAPELPLLVDRPELPSLTEPALPSGVEADWAPAQPAASGLPALADVAPRARPHPAGDDEHVELASLLKHLDAQGAVMAPRVPSPPGQGAGGLPSRLVALARLGGAPAAALAQPGPPAAASDIATPAASGPDTAVAPATPREEPQAEPQAALPPGTEAPGAVGAPLPAAEAVSAPEAALTGDAGTAFEGEDDAVAALLAAAAEPEPWPGDETVPAADEPNPAAPVDAAPPAAAAEEPLWSDDDAQAWLDTEPGPWSEAPAEPAGELEAVPAPSLPAPAPDPAPDPSTAVPDPAGLPDEPPPAEEEEELAFDLAFDLAPTPQAPAFPLAASDAVFGRVPPPPADPEDADFALDLDAGLPAAGAGALPGTDADEAAEAAEEIFLDMGDEPATATGFGAPTAPERSALPATSPPAADAFEAPAGLPQAQDAADASQEAFFLDLGDAPEAAAAGLDARTPSESADLPATPPQVADAFGALAGLPDPAGTAEAPEAFFLDLGDASEPAAPAPGEPEGSTAPSAPAATGFDAWTPQALTDLPATPPQGADGFGALAGLPDPESAAAAPDEFFLDLGDAPDAAAAAPVSWLPEAALPPAGAFETTDAAAAPEADAGDAAAAAAAAPAAEPLPPAPPLAPIAEAATLAPLEDEHRRVGPLRVPQSLFDIYIEEAEALSGRLHEKLWHWQPPQPLERELVVITHALSGMAATVGDQALSQLARVLEDTMAPCRRPGYATPLMKERLGEGVLRVREMLTQFAAGTLPPPLESAFLQYLRAPHEEAPPAAQGPFGPPVETRNPFGPPPQARKLEVADEELLPLPGDEGPRRLEDRDAAEARAPAAWDEGGEVPSLADDLEGLDLLDRLDGAEAPAPAGLGEEGLEAIPRHEPWGLPPVEGADDAATAEPAAAAGGDDLHTLDPGLFPVFEDEAQELLPQLAHSLRAWAADGGEEHAAACMRTLHTLKGGARLSGAMRLGDAAHALESAIEALLMRSGLPERAEIEELLARADALAAEFERLRAAAAPQAEEGASAVEAGVDADTRAEVEALAPPDAGAGAGEAGGTVAEEAGAEAVPQPDADLALADAALPPAEPVPPAVPAPDDTGAAPEPAPHAEDAPAIDWSRFAVEPPPLPPAAAAASPAATVRVRAPALDRLVAQAGEVGISRARLSVEMQQLGTSLADLDENLQRLRTQLREVELQAETQLDARLEATRPAAPAFDPLELDRCTRLQELARMMAESLDDVAAVQHSLRQGLRGTEDELVALARLAGELQDELLRTRLVAFDSLAERLQRVLRQAAQEAQRQVRLDIEGGEVEIDRGVLDRMAPAFEHLLRNAVVHGIEPPAERFMRGKPTEGRVLLRLTQEGAQVSLSCSDDGRGLDLPRIQRRAVERGLLALEAQPDAAALQRLVFAPGFSTAEQLSPLAGRGVGLDVVRAEVEALGGHITLETTPGQGSRFTLQLPLTTAVMQVLLLRCGEATVAVPAALVDEVLRVPAAEAQQAQARGRLGAGSEAPTFVRLEPLLQQPLPPAEAPEHMVTVLLLRGAQQRLALQVPEVLGRQEAVLKPLGPQLATLPGLAGMGLLPSGLPLPVYNPAALALRCTAAQQAAQVGGGAPRQAGAPGGDAAAEAPLVLVVDDSLTVRRATQRLLEREGYRVALAKDGLEALERLEQETPALVLTDLEMPRLDGFDLLRRLRAQPRWQALPVIVITSRLAARHRELAASLGVEHYLGKPCAQDELLALVASYSPALYAPN